MVASFNKFYGGINVVDANVDVSNRSIDDNTKEIDKSGPSISVTQEEPIIALYINKKEKTI